MSYTPNQIEIIEAAQADFDTALSLEKYDDCRAIIDSLGEQGFENESIFLHRALNRHFLTEDETPTEWKERADDFTF